MTTRNLIWIVILTLAFEGLTCASRFGLGLQSTRDTRFLRRIFFGLRIHHGYIGVLLLALLWFPIKQPFRDLAIRVGWALILSDLIHHFIVLWYFVGSPQFDFFYPEEG